MSVPFSLSTGNEHYQKHTPQGSMLSNLLEIIPKTPDIWYCDTFSMPDFGTLKHWYTGTVILYCWWDPADDRIIQHIDDMDLKFIIITSDPDLVPDHPRIKCVPWKYQYGYHMQLITNTGIYVDCEPRNFLCMMRNHKPERLAFLNGLRLNKMLSLGHVSYLGQVNTKEVHGRAARPIREILGVSTELDTNFVFSPGAEYKQWLKSNLPLELPGDTTQTFDNNTDFYTCGNPAWYKRTDYSIIMETYWARTKFLTEKSFKPIVAKHPFINLGNNSNWLLQQLGFDTFTDVFGEIHDGKGAAEKLDSVIPKLKRKYQVDPARCENNYQMGMQLLSLAQKEQKDLAEQVANLL